MEVFLVVPLSKTPPHHGRANSSTPYCTPRRTELASPVPTGPPEAPCPFPFEDARQRLGYFVKPRVPTTEGARNEPSSRAFSSAVVTHIYSVPCMLRWLSKLVCINIRNWKVAGADIGGHSQAFCLKLWYRRRMISTVGWFCGATSDLGLLDCGASAAFMTARRRCRRPQQANRSVH